ncbi:GNAT family N-acetyltransferase [Tabrizicola piscis]|uniref:GNAT family N-acetyltransferase n=1 Tax=Tabrizicola piscis TaxID=2494374 RepID=A0A3S8U9V3_9RHOB|nr:GNAT family N-acetyltransferase [Tabrizicola piscis]AZL60387.1 GNAT family N-acetyltransferase [Tabrizicola piscis]
MKVPAGAVPIVYQCPEDVPALAETWAAAQETAEFLGGEYRDYVSPGASPSGVQRRIAVLTKAAKPDLVLPFTRETHLHTFTVGERSLGRLPTMALRLANPWLSESHAPSDIAYLLRHVMQKEHVDLIDLGEIPENSALRGALDALAWPARKLRLGRKDSIRWLIDFPETFDAYLAGLSTSTRQSTRRKMRSLEKDFDLQFETFTLPQDVDRFLAEGEKISRLTYQWNVGQQLNDNAETRARFRDLADQGRLRCYLLSLDGVPRAFLRGTVEGQIYNYETPGFDPAFAKNSVGTVILMRALQDLITNTACRTFDFGTGGDEIGFKSRFGNRRLTCNSYYIVNAIRPRAGLLLAGQNALTGAKNLAAAVIGTGAFRDRIKRRLRKYGD